jgi:cell division septation protein DedD
MKIFTVAFLLLFSFTMVANAQVQSRGGFAAVPAPGQPTAPGAVTPQPVAPQPPGVARPTTPTQSTQQQQQQQQQEQLRIVADPATNSLIIYGTAQEFLNIKGILKDLDAVPRQVLLDVLIAEITRTDNQSLGVDYEILRRNPQSIFGQRFPSAGAIRSLGSVLFPGTGSFGAGVTGIFGGDDIRAIVNALQADSRVKILSSPTVLATDNRPARIQVGSEEPVATGTITAAVGTVGSSTTISYRNTGRIVTIIPQVNSQGLVNLQILAEVSQRGENVRVGNVGDTFPSFDTRQAETTAVVQDGDTLAIGGIIAENVTRDQSGIPYLMDIPVVGRFFRTSSDTVRRTELVMLITPHVIRNRDEARSVTYDFKNSMSAVRNELERIAREQAKLVPKPSPQVLPPMPEPNVIEPVPPQPAPSSMVPRQGASVPATTPSTGVAMFVSPAQPQPSFPLESRTVEPAGNLPPPEIIPEVVTPKPQGFALSLVPVEVKPRVAIATAKPAAGKTADKQNRVWAVQVAALAENKDAESMAAKLRKVGHQAYVLTSQVAEKVWHRVRIGKFPNQNDAQELRKDLATTTEFRQAYVAAN